MKRLIDRLMEPEEETANPDAQSKEYITEPKQVRISSGDDWLWGSATLTTDGFIMGPHTTDSTITDSTAVGPMGTQKTEITLDEALAKLAANWPINTDYNPPASSWNTDYAKELTDAYRRIKNDPPGD